MKINKNFLLIFVITFLATSFFKPNKAFAGAGLAAGVEFNLLNNILIDSRVPPSVDWLFVGGDVFANYYNNNIIDYTYGLRARAGYKLLGVQIYGLGGSQHIGFNKYSTENFKKNSAPFYGYGIGYNFPLGIGVRLNRTFFSLNKTAGGKENFAFTEAQLVLAF